jgi:Tetratricopeptide repeat/NB-ARC domain
VTASDQQRGAGVVPAIWGAIPQRNKNFTGRDGLLNRLRPGVSSTVTAVLPHALQGMGGVGKTALAIEYAHRYRSDYDLVWWIPADQPALVRSSLAALAEPLGLQSATAMGIDGAVLSVLDALRRGSPYSRWLLIFDNADQPEDLNPTIPRGPGDVLITSRNHRWQAVVDTMQVDVFERAESAEFLTKRVPRGLSEPEARQLADELGDLPLALEQAGALQAETGMRVEEYSKLLKENVASILEEGKPPEYPLSMTAAWRISVATMSRQLPEAVDLLRCCAFFGAEPIPREVFQSGIQSTETRISELIADPILLARAIRELGRFALVRIDGRTIGIHRLVQALLREALGPDQQASYRHEVHLILAASSPKDPDNNRMWPRYAGLVAHVVSPTTDIQSCRDASVRGFALEIVRYLYRSGDPKSSRALAERLIERWIEDSGQDDAHVLDAQRHLGIALRDLGRYSDAYAVNRATLDRTRRILGERNPLTLTLRNSSGADLRARGDFSAARSLDEESLGLHKEVFGETDPQTLRVMNNLALDYGLNSNYRAAREQHQSTYLLQSKAKTGVSAAEILNSWNGLARAVRLGGDYTVARDVGEDAYDFGREVLGTDHYETLQTATDLSIALRRIASTYDEALDLAQDTFGRSTGLLGPGHPDTLAAAISLTNIQRTTGQTAEALVLAESTVDSYPDIYGPAHPYSYGCSGNLALMRRVTGDPAGARYLNEIALDGLDASLGRAHHYSLTVATNLASDLAALGDIAEALSLGWDTLAQLRTLLGENHPLTLGCAANLVVDLRAAGSNEEAEQLSADTLNLYVTTLGKDHPDTTTAAGGGRLDFDFDPPPI